MHRYSWLIALIAFVIFVNVNKGNAQTAVSIAPATFTNTTITVAASSSVALSANALRKYLSVQNNHATASISCTPDGQVATMLNGVLILAGQMWVPNVPPRGAITCINSSGSNTTVIVTEGQ